MRPQRKRMMVETTHAFVKLKQIKAAVSAGGIKFESKTRPIQALQPLQFRPPRQNCVCGPSTSPPELMFETRHPQECVVFYMLSRLIPDATGYLDQALGSELVKQTRSPGQNCGSEADHPRVGIERQGELVL